MDSNVFYSILNVFFTSMMCVAKQNNCPTVDHIYHTQT